MSGTLAKIAEIEAEVTRRASVCSAPGAGHARGRSGAGPCRAVPGRRGREARGGRTRSAGPVPVLRARLLLQMARTQKNKATAHHLGLLKARLAKLRRELITPKGGGGGGPGEGAS